MLFDLFAKSAAPELTPLAWLIPVPPLLAFFLIVLFTHRSKGLSHILAVGMMGLSWVLSWLVFFRVIGIEHFGEEVVESALNWLPFGSEAAGTEPLRMGVLVDPLTAVTLFFVSLACLMIFIYSVGYNNWGKPRDPHDLPGHPPHNGIEPLYSRFFAYLSLFAFGMLTLVVADNLLLLFIGWEIMGLCSYLLIGFWYAREYPDPNQITPRQAAVKAFMATRVGDVMMMLGIVYLYAQTGTLSFREILYAHEGEMLAALASTPSFVVGLSTASLIGLLLFAGTVGKSAQFPLHVWLPDAMEGPTPVSAMIHAATMVSAGVYAMIRLFPLLSAGWHHGDPLTPAMWAMAFIGTFTALFAATIAVAQNDVKKVLAYSTISQLGYMIGALGIGAYIAAAFHLVTHAFFKALLFLGSGSVIHGMEHGQHHVTHSPVGATHGHEHGGGHGAEGSPLAGYFDPQNMFNMGGLRQRMPITFWTFLIGGLALAGFPLVTAGFWSKDAILGGAWEGGYIVVFVTLAVAAFLTAFYTMRQISLTFLGQPRTAAAEHATERDPIFRTILFALVVLAFFAITAGWVGIPNDFLGLNLGRVNWFHEFVGGTLAEHPAEEIFNIVPLLTSIVVALGGLLLGWWVYRDVRVGAADPLIAPLGPLHTLLKNKYYFDEIYDFLFVRPARWFSETFTSAWVDRGVIDGTLHTIGRAAPRVGDAFRNYIDAPVVNGFGDLVGESVKRFGRAFRIIQTGRVQYYLLVVMVMVIAMGAVVLFLPGLGR
jgi:NADH-quinone oxidoreductase subunit L